MLKITKTPFAFLLLFFLLFVSPAAAVPVSLPWLDFGFNFSYDGAGTFTSMPGGTRVLGTTYKDGSFGFYGSEPILGAPVALDLTFDGLQNDTLTVDGWFTADVVLRSNTFNPVTGTPNPYIAYLDNFTVDPLAPSSQWLTEFVSTINPGTPFDATLVLAFAGSCGPDEYGKYLINGMGKVAVPEPATMLMLGIGLFGLAGVSRKKMIRK